MHNTNNGKICSCWNLMQAVDQKPNNYLERPNGQQPQASISRIIGINAHRQYTYPMKTVYGLLNIPDNIHLPSCMHAFWCLHVVSNSDPQSAGIPVDSYSQRVSYPIPGCGTIYWTISVGRVSNENRVMFLFCCFC